MPSRVPEHLGVTIAGSRCGCDSWPNSLSPQGLSEGDNSHLTVHVASPQTSSHSLTRGQHAPAPVTLPVGLAYKECRGWCNALAEGPEGKVAEKELTGGCKKCRTPRWPFLPSPWLPFTHTFTQLLSMHLPAARPPSHLPVWVQVLHQLTQPL